MTTYYVRTDGSNVNSGLANTAGGAWLTLQKAANTVVAGDTVMVADGTYAGTISETTSGTSGNRIRYESINRHGAKIVPVGVGSNTMWSVSGGYNDIIGFEVDGTGGTSVRIGIVMTGGNTNCRQCYVHDIGMNSGCDSNGGAGILCNQASGTGSSNVNYEITECHVAYVGGTCSFINAIYHQSSGKIQNCLVHNSAAGIVCSHDDHNLLISNNTIFRCLVNAYYFGGCSESYPGGWGCPTSGVYFFNNIVYDNQGTYAVSGPATSEDSDNVLQYNCFFGNVNNFDMGANAQASRAHEVNANPTFVSYSALGTGDYHLASASTLKAAGDPTHAPTTDYDGNLRNGATVSMGAFEFSSAPPNQPGQGGVLRKHIFHNR